MNHGPIRTLTLDERGMWGECSVCLARHGERCAGELAVTPASDRYMMSDGVHISRLRNAPFRVREVAA